MDGSQKEGGNVFNFLQKEGIPRKGGFPQNRGGGPTLEETMQVIAYRNDKNSDNAKFSSDIITTSSNVDNYGIYKNTIFNIFNCHIPIKKRFICTNEAPFLPKKELQINKLIPEILNRH